MHEDENNGSNKKILHEYNGHQKVATTEELNLTYNFTTMAIVVTYSKG